MAGRWQEEFTQGETWEVVCVLEEPDGTPLDLTGSAWSGRLWTSTEAPTYTLEITVIAHPDTDTANQAVRIAVDDTVSSSIPAGVYRTQILCTLAGGEPFEIFAGSTRVIQGAP